jgi:hypothetical protein
MRIGVSFAGGRLPNFSLHQQSVAAVFSQFTFTRWQRAVSKRGTPIERDGGCEGRVDRRRH